MKHLNPNDADDIRNWVYHGWEERIKISLFFGLGILLIMCVFFVRVLDDYMPDKIIILILSIPSIIFIVRFNKKVTKHNEEVIRFKRMTEEEQNEYLQRRDSNFKK
jgi:hypothetical protein